MTDVRHYSDYYAFGSPMPGRNGGSSYRYGFNGQEKDNEVTGNIGATYTAEFWEYDSRLGRRWNTDPVLKAYQSPYASFSNNPIVRVDPAGDDDYYNSKGDYLGSDNNTKNAQIRIVTCYDVYDKNGKIDRNLAQENSISFSAYMASSKYQTIEKMSAFQTIGRHYGAPMGFTDATLFISTDEIADAPMSSSHGISYLNYNFAKYTLLDNVANF